MTSRTDISYAQLVCSGGGTRCCWQGGWLDVVRDEIALSPDRISAVSGGALTAAGFVTRSGRTVLDTMCAAFSALDSNVDPHELIEDEGLSLHQRTYREIVNDVFDASRQREVADGPSFQVLLGHPPTDTLAKFTGTAATMAYEAELHLIGSPHFNWAERLGVRASLIDARAAAADGKLADLICAAAVIPPLFDLPEWDGRKIIDGGMSDQAPLPDPDEGRSLILLTRDYKSVPEIATRDYIMPDKAVPADKIDFTDPDKLRQSWATGEKAGRRFLESTAKNSG
ncbi:patatin-like phospholipase family protein [Sulfitobacter sp. HNIBRBA3233]|uniref:patatin-like phospholipase family protein n=1 Tax=Sulfitobacter marinivivus TaxID=3158558 RepID=UPI0032DF6873